MNPSQPIPHPPQFPLIGSLPAVFGDTIIADLMQLAQQYGEFFELKLPGTRFFVASSHAVVREVCSEENFRKVVGNALIIVRRFTGDGLFTAHHGEPNWGVAHNILMPGFAPKQMKDYLPSMIEVAHSLLKKWERNPGQEIQVTDDFTRLTLDTIALCGFDFHFNSFDNDSMHPFVDAMVFCLKDSLRRMKKPKIQQLLERRNEQRYMASRDLMFRVVDQVLEERTRHPELFKDKVDFLSLMLNGIDRKSGQKLSLENIRYQLITFLIAGHDTTSGMLSFATHFLLKNPDIMNKAVAEVDRVFGSDPDFIPSLKDVHSLRYIIAILRESIRLWPTASGFARAPYNDTVLAGRYGIKKDDEVLVLLASLHRDPLVWSDPEVFDPDRFMPGREEKIPEFAYLPFGTGARSCIGQHFAMTEAALAMGLVLKHFHLRGEPAYKLQLQETLTVKPHQLRMWVEPRITLPRTSSAKAKDIKEAVRQKPKLVEETSQGLPLYVYYGSNMGTAEDLARQLADQGRRAGFKIWIGSLDEAVDRLPQTGTILVVTSTYNGFPPDNAKEFSTWFRSASVDLSGVQFSVFGCGNTQWKTYQAFPRELEDLFLSKGAKPLVPRGEADVNGDWEISYQRYTQNLWPEIKQKLGVGLDPGDLSGVAHKKLSIEVLPDTVAHPYQSLFHAKPYRILGKRDLFWQTDADGRVRATLHLDLALPPEANYQPGDHLGVFAENRPQLVQDLAHRLGYSVDSVLVIKADNQSSQVLPLNTPVTLGQLLREHIEIQDVVTRQQLQVLATCCATRSEADVLTSWAAADEAGVKAYQTEVLSQSLNIFDLLQRFKSCNPSLDTFLQISSPLKPRYYSISSAPAHKKSQLSLTVGVIEGPAWSGRGIFKGVCSHFLHTREAGDIIMGFIRQPQQNFRLPEDTMKPLIMVGPGTGFAPFRGFLQDRAMRQEKGASLGPAVLFFGCRNRDDFIYEDELNDFVAKKVVTLHTAFSRLPQQKKVYVQDLIWEQRSELWKLLENDATVLVCGDGFAMAPAVRETFLRIYQEKTGQGSAEALAWMDKREKEGRYVVDIFGVKLSSTPG